MNRECVTHHHACDCREEKFKQLEKENAEKDRLIKQLKKENSELKEELAKERECVEFYGNESHWDDRVLVMLTDEESTKCHDYCGGKLARQRIKERKDFNAN